MTEAPLFETSSLQRAFEALRQDLIHPGGPRISTMRNYPFAILQYRPDAEFALRREVQRLTSELVAHGWVVVTIDLQRLLLDRVQRQGPEFSQRIIEMEKRLAASDLQRGLAYLVQKLTPQIEGPTGLAADCARVIAEHVARHPDRADRTVVFLGRAGALYPYFRTSALLRDLDGKTGNVPVVLLYPGERRGATGLSFMGILDADSDYRPRIYS